MRNKVIFALSALGILAGLVAAWYFGIERKAQPPAFAPVSSPYVTAIYANGIVESDQPGGANISIFPEVTGRVAQVLVHEGQTVSAGQALMTLDSSVQSAATLQAGRQVEAAKALLDELVAQPRAEVLAVAKSQLELAQANLKLARDQSDKRSASFEIDPHSISQDALDTAANTTREAIVAVDVARRQYELIQAGAWRFDVLNQRHQVEALTAAHEAALALLRKYTIRAQTDGVVLAVNTAPGTTVSTLGAFDAYTQGQLPVVVMSGRQDYLAVRCYVDEILVSRLPPPDQIQAQMSMRGTDTKVALEFVRVQPYVTPKIELSNQRQEKVDLRVLPVIFRFKMTNPVMAYPGQLVDVFIGKK